MGGCDSGRGSSPAHAEEGVTVGMIELDGAPKIEATLSPGIWQRSRAPADRRSREAVAYWLRPWRIQAYRGECSDVDDEKGSNVDGERQITR
jgi:hypothetical protein